MPQQSAVTLREVSKVYGDVSALERFSLDVPTGNLVCLLGPSGCGKTTTLRLIAGFAAPTHGRVFIEGADVTAKPPHLRDIGIVFQHHALFPHLSVFENVEFGLRNIGARKLSTGAFGRSAAARGPCPGPRAEASSASS